MLKKRIIPCLDVQNGRTVKGVNFINIRDAGDPVELAIQYDKEGADELVFLDITATVEKRATMIPWVQKVAQSIRIPFTVGGGISSLEDAKAIISAGADKVAVNSAAIKRPELIQDIADYFGQQCVVVAVDTKKVEEKNIVFTHGGRKATSWETEAWVGKAEELGAGEILLTSMDHDGTKSGFALEITDAIAEKVNIPVIASGGAGAIQDFSDLFSMTKASAGLAASIFHYGEVPIPQLKKELQNQNIPIR